MNLYRSFGNLMEAWVTEGGQCLDSAWPENNDDDPRTPSSDVGTNLRSQSVDSGVETASSVMSYPATPCSVSTENAELDTFTPQREGDSFPSASTSQSPVISSPVPSSSSSSSLHLHHSGVQWSSSALNLKVEQALQKTNSKHLKKNREPLVRDEMHGRRPAASLEHKQEQSKLVRGQRSQSLGLKRTVDPSVTMRQKSEMCRRPMSMNCERRSEDPSEETTRLSPGLCYLEEVCQMLEEFARQQMQGQVLQVETDGLQEHQDMEILATSQSHCTAEEECSSCQSREHTECAEQSELQQQKHLHRHFRQRSASDTNIYALQFRKSNADCRGQQQSIDDLLEMEEEDQEQQGSEQEEAKKTNRNWKLKFASFTKASTVRNTKGEQMQSSEKKSTWRRLSQLIKRRKTLPL